jgi:hypothetical protein
MAAPGSVECKILTPVPRDAVKKFPTVPVVLTPRLKLAVAVGLNPVAEYREHHHH